MNNRVHSFVLRGIDAMPCEVEVDIIGANQASTTVVGLPSASVRESVKRVKAAVRNSGYGFPEDAQLTINLAPADIPKEGPVYDLPIAVALLLAQATIALPAADRPRPDAYVIAGELALDGRVRSIRGALSLGLMARRLGARGVIVPVANAAEAAAVGEIEVLGVTSLEEVVGLFNGGQQVEPAPPLDIESMVATARPEIDFADVRGQEAAKRALLVAAAGRHNIVMIGPPGTGKTMLAKALTGILPPLSREEVLEVTRIYSSAGRIPAREPLVLRRPVRAPHHTASAAAIIGGGSVPRPGDVSLAHRGVLFLDEMPEFSRSVLETLRQPMEDGRVTIARARGSTRFPARFMLVGALNPTAKGGVGSADIGGRDMERYLSRLSRPLIDRIDIHVEVPAVPYHRLAAARNGSDTATLREQVRAALERQRARQGGRTNAELPPRLLDDVVRLDETGRALLAQAMTELGLSARAYDKIRRVARTIADVDGSPDVRAEHIAEAVQYRLLDRER